MKTLFTKAVLGTALAATAALGMVAAATPAQARDWGYRGHGGGGVAVAAGLIGLAAGVAIASDHGPYVAPVGYYPPVAYAPAPVCYNAYPGYDGYCYPVTYYTNLGWGWHDGYWWYGGARYARPFIVGGYRGGYGGGYRGGYVAGGYRGGYAGGYRGGYAAPAYRGGYAGGGYGHGGYTGGHGGNAGGNHGGGNHGGGYGHR